jgi:hypothetical protein
LRPHEQGLLRLVQPPGLAGPVPHERLGEELLAVAGDGGEVGLADEHRPVATRASGIAEYLLLVAGR